MKRMRRLIPTNQKKKKQNGNEYVEEAFEVQLDDDFCYVVCFSWFNIDEISFR